MSDFEVVIAGPDRLMARLAALSDRKRAAMAGAVARSGKLVHGRARANASEGTPLHARRGRLAGAIDMYFTGTESAFTAAVSVSKRVVPYAAILEYGGQTRPHEFGPVRARALRFLGGGSRLPIGKTGSTGDVVFAKRVKHPGSKIPEYSYLRRALAQSRSEVIEMIRAAALAE